MILDVKVFFLKSEKVNAENSSSARLARRDFRLEKCVSVRCQLFLGVECCATFQAALYIETHSMMHQSEFDAANVALSRAADKRKSLINIHKNRYTATLKLTHSSSIGDTL